MTKTACFHLAVCWQLGLQALLRKRQHYFMQKWKLCYFKPLMYLMGAYSQMTRLTKCCQQQTGSRTRLSSYLENTLLILSHMLPTVLVILWEILERACRDGEKMEDRKRERKRKESMEENKNTEKTLINMWQWLWYNKMHMWIHVQLLQCSFPLMGIRHQSPKNHVWM